MLTFPIESWFFGYTLFPDTPNLGSFFGPPSSNSEDTVRDEGSQGGNARVEQRLLSLEEGFNTFKEFTEQQQKAFLFPHGWTNSRNLIWNDVHVMFRYCWVSSSQVFLGFHCNIFFFTKRSSQTVRCLSCPLPSWPTLSSSFPPRKSSQFAQIHHHVMALRPNGLLWTCRSTLLKEI